LTLSGGISECIETLPAKEWLANEVTANSVMVNIKFFIFFSSWNGWSFGVVCQVVPL
jgi:hypothetical protein